MQRSRGLQMYGGKGDGITRSYLINSISVILKERSNWRISSCTPESEMLRYAQHDKLFIRWVL